MANCLSAGLVGFLDIHPNTYREAWRTRFHESKLEAEAKAKESSGEGTTPTAPSSSSS